MAELLASLSLAVDLGVGQRMEWVMRSCLLARGLGKAAGLSQAQLRNVYYLSLLRHVGCNATASWSARAFGDDLALAEGFNIDMGNMSEAMGFVLRAVGKGKPLVERLGMLARFFAVGMEMGKEAHDSHCEIAERLAERLGFDETLRRALWQTYERWDGRGGPKKLRGGQLAIEVRVALLAQDAATLHAMGGPEAALEAARKRSGGLYDPALVEIFRREAGSLLAPLAGESVWDAVLEAEPGAPLMIAEDRMDAALEAAADFSDMKSPYLLGHSRGVAELAAAAARQCGLSAADAADLRRAALVHDIGRVAVSAAIWDKAGPLGDGEWERVRMHSYYTERILARSPALARLSEIAAAHHERMDGTGYHRRYPAALQPPSARILAAADVYRALREDRPHRAAFSLPAAAAELRREAASGRLDARAAEAVLAAAGHRASPAKAPAGGLSAREMEVLRLLVRGLSNREMGKRLFISPKTVGHHVQHIYGKIEVSTRAGAALFAARNNLLAK
jgi:HD-GYP domain-containing protein (c-di-GMP phosphodiesterase class II)